MEKNPLVAKNQKQKKKFVQGEGMKYVVVHGMLRFNLYGTNSKL